jgi:hypothetical protein
MQLKIGLKIVQKIEKILFKLHSSIYWYMISKEEAMLAKKVNYKIKLLPRSKA